MSIKEDYYRDLDRIGMITHKNANAYIRELEDELEKLKEKVKENEKN